MKKPVTLTRRIPSFWSIVEQIRDDVKTSLSGYPEEIQNAGVMTASELIYDTDSKWQCASFKALETLASIMRHISVGGGDMIIVLTVAG